MKKAYLPLLALLLTFSPLLLCSGATNAVTPLRSYPWIESSEYARIGKDLLDRIAIPSVRITNFNTMQLVLTPEFIAAFLLTPEEVGRVSAAITNALHEYRIVQGKNLEPLDDDAVFERARSEAADASGYFRFRLNPFEAEAVAIRHKLRSNISEILRPQRDGFFWLQGEMRLNSQMAATNHARFLGQTHLFGPLTGPPGPLVDVKVTYSGGSHGRPYGEALDQYAPDKLKPILKRWREWISEKPRGSFAWTAPASEQTVIDTPLNTTPPKWDDTSDYVDLPKTVIRALKVPGLTDDEEISAEAIALLGLSTNEVNAVTQLYGAMNSRLEQLERSNFVRPDPEQTRFILRAFPEKAAALKQDWLTKLKDVVGGGRAELLDQSIRTPLDFLIRMLRGRNDREWLRRDNVGPLWFDRGLFEMQIDVQTVLGPKGREIREIRYKSNREDRSTGGPRLNIPRRFRHLLTTEMFEVLPVL